MTILCLTVLGLTARGAGAQFLQYTPPGGPEVSPESRQEQLKRELGRGPLPPRPGAHRPLGHPARPRLRAEPPVHRRSRQPNDFTATAGAGFRAYLRNGPKATWTAQVLPEYVWWQRQTPAAAAQRPLSPRLLRLLQPPHRGGEGGARAAAAARHPRGAGAGQLPARRRRGADRARRSPAPSRPSPRSPSNRENNLVDGPARSRTSRPPPPRPRRAGRARRGALAPRPAVVGGAGGRALARSTSPTALLDRSNTGTAPVAEVNFQGHRVALPARRRGPLADGDPGGRVRPLPRA